MRKAILAGAAAAVAVAACGAARSENGGPTVDRNYAVGNFDRMELAGNYDVTVHTGGQPSVHARGAQKTMERLVVEVRGGVLVIEPKKHGGFNWGSNHGKVTVDVTVPSLRGAQLAGAGNMRIDNVKGDRFEGEIAGAGDLTLDRIEVGALKLGVAGAGNAKLGTGRVQTASYEIVGSGGIDAGGVAAQSASISIAGAGDVKANASDTANVDIMGSGDVDLKGGAKCTISKAGAGDVRCS